MVAEDILVKRVHEDGKKQRTNDREHDGTLDVAFHLTSDVRGELEAYELEEDDTDQTRQAYQSRVERKVRIANRKSRFARRARDLCG